MRHIIYIFFFFLIHSSLAQTKLINHKSHSGTNKTFNPHIVNGNFGEVSIKEIEILKNKKSNYSLTRAERFGTLIYVLKKILIKKNKKSLDYFDIIIIKPSNQNEKFIQSLEKKLTKKLYVHIEIEQTLENKKFIKSLERLIIKRLKEFRAIEKK